MEASTILRAKVERRGKSVATAEGELSLGGGISSCSNRTSTTDVLRTVCVCRGEAVNVVGSRKIYFSFFLLPPSHLPMLPTVQLSQAHLESSLGNKGPRRLRGPGATVGNCHKLDGLP